MEQRNRLPILKTLARLLSFRLTPEEFAQLSDWRFLAFGMLGTWIVGIGRHWDAPNVEPLKQSGIGSIAYVFLLSLLLYLFGEPLKPRNWSYGRVLTFVSLTSFPAAVYAIPVERWTDMATAQLLNVLFLLFVATYRISLYVSFLKRSSGLDGFTAFVATALPIMAIVSVIVLSGHARIVFDIMGGLGTTTPTVDDAVNGILLFITGLTFCGGLPVLILYLALIGRAYNMRTKVSAQSGSESTSTDVRVGG